MTASDIFYADTLIAVRCLQCGHAQPPTAYLASACSACGSQWLDAEYDYSRVQPMWQNGLMGREFSMWRYHELLPIQRTLPELGMGEGWTPLTRLYPYEKIYQHPYIFVKDERAQPTNSFKDRQAALTTMALKQQGITEIVLASTGNAAVAYAAYCARAGIKLWLFLTSLVPAEKMREAALYGCEVVKVSGTYDETKHVAAEFAQRKGIHFDRGAKAVPGKESMKTLAYEIAEQLGLQAHTGEKWIAPDWYIQAVSGGIGPLGVWKGFQELHHLGLIDKLPKLAIVQAAGCAPMVNAFHANQAKATPVIPQTLITVLATGDPGYSYELLREAVLTGGGTMLAIEDGETFTAMRNIASKGGLSVEPATAVAFAGLEKMLQNNTIAPDEVVVINCSGHTFSAESHILGDQYEQYILDLKVNTEKNTPTPKVQEGLGGAIQNLDEQVTTIVIVDDNANDRRLIRRLLQSYKRYRVYEAQNGADGIKVIKDRKPDLVITDLTMPEVDGFSLLETLKADPDTAKIPVMVVSAKTLTPRDRQMLDSLSASVWQKGGFDTRSLVQEVVNTLGHTPIDVITQKPKAVVSDTVEDTHQTIVVIDDNPDDLRLAKRILQSGHYTVIEAQNGRDGLKAIYSYHPDLIILDLNLPDLDGLTILDTLQRDSNLKDIPVVVYSARDLTPEQLEATQSQIRRVIRKSSLDRQEFLDAIKEELV
jgi:threonine synthase